MPVDVTPLAVWTAVAWGAAFGMSACTLGCLPALGPVFMAEGGGVAGSWRILLPFSAGRIAGYALLAALAGGAGSGLVDPGSVLRLLPGVAAVAVGILFMLRPTGSGECVHSERMGRCGVMLPPGLLLMGTGMALTPCAPLALVLFAAAATGTPLGGAVYGIGFGTGAVVAPALLYGVGFAYFADRLHQRFRGRRRLMDRCAAAVLIMTGVVSLVPVLTTGMI